ncbi:hypothetical protein [Pseudonocardia acaciae]|uniref:hypothetical protein n=1 Tax=Pseudonocardia acaciae TaxID=551276 RepID=UPI00048FBF5C|nr:hypothetical protein [Pseudonocardia acaciae]
MISTYADDSYLFTTSEDRVDYEVAVPSRRISTETPGYQWTISVIVEGDRRTVAHIALTVDGSGAPQLRLGRDRYPGTVRGWDELEGKLPLQSRGSQKRARRAVERDTLDKVPFDWRGLGSGMGMGLAGIAMAVAALAVLSTPFVLAAVFGLPWLIVVVYGGAMIVCVFLSIIGRL